MIRYFVTALLSTLFLLFRTYAGPPCDISLLTIDLKYNEEDGVKICEVQQGLNSALIGATFLTQSEGLVAERLSSTLSQYNLPVWYCMGGISKYYLSIFKKQRGWKEAFSFNYLLKNKKFEKRNKKRVQDSASIRSHHGLVIAGYNSIDMAKLHKLTGILILNKAFLNGFGDYEFTDKKTMSRLFLGNEKLEQLKPRWKFYPKHYTTTLVQTILNDFKSEYLVIKPRVGLKGRGVIIFHHTELDDILRTLFDNPVDLKDHPDKSFNYWAKDSRSEFLIEEFYPSTPVEAPHLTDGLYDGTMRVIALLTYDEGKASVDFIYSFWKLPQKALNEPGTLTEKHKSFSGSEEHYSSVETNVQNKVEETLRQGLIVLYEQILIPN